MVFRIAGYSLPRDIKRLSVQGKKVGSFVEARTGDIAFFSIKGNTPTHCGILMGEDRIIHAHGQVRMDAINEEGIIVPETKIYTHFLHSLRRVIA